IRLSDLVVVPTIPDFISVYGIAAFLKILWFSPLGGLPRPKQLPHVLVNRFEGTKQHKEIVERLEAAANIKVPEIRLLRTRVKKAAELAAALAKVDEAPTFKQKYGKVTDVLNQLVRELKEVLHAN
ncbi:MAG: hypothetical protein ACRECN_06280, partial [Methylocella sp.]